MQRSLPLLPPSLHASSNRRYRSVEGAMSADLNVNHIQEKIPVLDQPEESTRVDSNGSGKVNDHHGPDPVYSEDSVADQVGELKADRVESESITGFRDDDDLIEKEEDLQDVEKGREEKLAEIPEDHDVEGNKKELINHAEHSNAEAQESQDTSVHVAESELNQSNNDEEKVEVKSKLNSAIDVREHEDSQAVVINGVHNDLDRAELITTEDVAESEPISPEKKLKELMNNDDVTESKPNQSSNDGEKVEEESKLDSVVHEEEIEDSQAVVINGVCNNLDLNQEKDLSESIKDLPQEDSVEESKDPFKQNLETAPCPVMADEKLEAESVEGPTSDENRDGLPAGHAQDTVAETQVVDDLVDAKQNISKSSSENVATSDAETDQSFQISSENGTIGDKANHIIMDAVQSEASDANGLDIHGKGDLLTSQESASQTVLVNDSVHTPEQNQTSDISTEVSSPANHEDAPVESSETFPVSPINDIGAELVVRIDDSCPVEDSKLCDTVRTETEVDNIGENADSHPVDDSKAEAEVENVLLAPSGHANDVKPDMGTSPHTIDSDEKLSILSIDNADVESEVTEAVTEGDSNRTSVSIGNPDGERCDSTGNESYIPKIEVQADSEVENISTAPMEEVPNRDGLVSQLKDTTFDEDSKNENPKPTVEDSAVVTSDEQHIVAELGKGPFYIIKVPKFDERNLREKVEDAKFEVEEKSKIRDAIQAQIQIEKAKRKEYEDSFVDARSEEKAARDLLKAKRKEIDSVQYIINRTRNVLEIEEIDGRIRTTEHKIQHETLPLKEEKQYIRDIKQLKQIREQLSSNMGSQDEVQQAMDQKDQSEERIKSLRKEADVLRDRLLKAEAVTEDARKKYNDEHEKINQLLFQHRAANDVRQEAFAHLQSLRKQLYEKSKYFYKYKDDLTAATNLALKGDKEELQRHCANQVERVMELWNNHDEFRKEYTSSNMRSTLRRLRTLDGRALGPDEQPPIIPSVVSQRVARANVVAPSAPALEVEKLVTPEDRGIEEGKGRSHVKGATKIGGEGQSKRGNGEEKKKCRKGQARASLRAQREAEQKEKEKEKKAKKKEKKKAAAEDAKDIDEESETTAKPVAVTKRPQKPSQVAKQTKAKSMPLPLRNKGKRKMQTWMWALVTLLAVIALLFMGNSSFFNFGLLQRSGI
ncbi:myosin heavy chain, fast skeletal muscle [Salix suchowensis]|nr:myosin heavy chain, fast skeletal muscle [Salix suchowensis]